MSGSGDMLADRETQTRTAQLLRSPYRWGGGTYTSLHATIDGTRSIMFLNFPSVCMYVSVTGRGHSSTGLPSSSSFELDLSCFVASVVEL